MFDQAEIDALLSSVEAQNAAPDDGVVQIFSRHRRDSEPIEISDYDFRRPERISKDQLRALETLHESFARDLGGALTAYLRTITEVSLAQVEQMSYAEFIGSLPNPTSCTLLESPGLEGRLGLELSPLIIYPIIDRLLGGSSDELSIPQRPLTAIEARLVRQILTRAAACLSDAWEDLSKDGFTLGEMETNPQLVQLVAPNEVVVIVRFELRMSKRAGGMALCIPFDVIEDLVGELRARNWFGRARTGQGGHTGGTQGASSPPAEAGHWRADVAAHLGRVPVNLSAVLAETTITVRELQHLEVGDVIETARDVREPATLCVEGRAKFRGMLGQSRGKRAIEVSD